MAVEIVEYLTIEVFRHASRSERVHSFTHGSQEADIINERG